MAIRGHKLKKNRNYTKKHKISASEILSKDLTELSSLNKETLRKALVVVNQSANKELARISKMSQINKVKLTSKYPLIQGRIDLTQKGKYSRFSTWPHMTKADIINELIKRKSYFETIPTPEKQKQQQEFRDKIIKDYIKEYNEIDYDNIKKTKPTLKKLGKLLQRLEDEHKIAAKAGTSGYSLGSPNAISIAFNIAFENPYLGIDKLYSKIESALQNAVEEQRLQQRKEDDILSGNFGA